MDSLSPSSMHLCPGCFHAPMSQTACSNCGFDVRIPMPPQRLPLNTLLNSQFIMGKILGVPGGFGVTYLAWDELLQHRVAIKEFFPSDLAQRLPNRLGVMPLIPDRATDFEQGLDGFLREARFLAKLNHPNIVRIRTFFKANGTAYMVMDYYEGMNLEEYFRRNGVLSEKEALSLFLPILDGLNAVHDLGILHRDIKPENIYLTHAGVPLLLDFGTARQELNQKSRHYTVVLTRGFAPPEQYSERGRQGVWTDIYALGATLYYLVTGKVPADALDRSHEDKFIPANQLNPALSAPFSDAISACLMLRPEKRPNSIRNLETLLKKSSTISGKNEAKTSQKPNPKAQSLKPKPSTKREMSCPQCKVVNLLPQGADMHQLRCGRCDTLLLPRNHVLVECNWCHAKNKIGITANHQQHWCGKCGQRLG